MRLAQDKIAHLRAGLAVLLVATVAGLALLHLGLRPLSVALLLAGVGAAAAVEYAQRDSNARLRALGQPPLHDVSLPDLLASAAPCVAGALLLELWQRLGWGLLL